MALHFMTYDIHTVPVINRDKFHVCTPTGCAGVKAHIEQTKL